MTRDDVMQIEEGRYRESSFRVLDFQSMHLSRGSAATCHFERRWTPPFGEKEHIQQEVVVYVALDGRDPKRIACELVDWDYQQRDSHE